MTRAPGFTLAELALVLALLGVLLGLALPPLALWRDRYAVRAARDELAGALARVRLTAVAAGGAALVLDPADARVWTRTPRADSLDPLHLGARYGVTLDAAGSGVAALEYDALGIGRIASRTITLRRGEAAAGVTVSAYGRVRPW